MRCVGVLVLLLLVVSCGGSDGMSSTDAAIRYRAAGQPPALPLSELAELLGGLEVDCDLGRQESMAFAIARTQGDPAPLEMARIRVALCPDVDVVRLAELAGVPEATVGWMVDRAEG
jgi:hypothetical protein